MSNPRLDAAAERSWVAFDDFPLSQCGDCYIAGFKAAIRHPAIRAALAYVPREVREYKALKDAGFLEDEE